MTETILSIVFAVLTCALTILNYYTSVVKNLKTTALEKINAAENMSITGEEKMTFVVETLLASIPVVWKPFISATFVRTLVQTIFDQVKAFAEKQQH